jgi:hypothetical protein
MKNRIHKEKNEIDFLKSSIKWLKEKMCLEEGAIRILQN